MDLEIFEGDLRNIKAFTYTNWVASVNDRRSTLGYYKLVWGNLATYRSKKQFVMERSSGDVELKAIV